MTCIDAIVTLLMCLFLLAISPLVLVGALIYGIVLGIWRACHGR